MSKSRKVSRPQPQELPQVIEAAAAAIEDLKGTDPLVLDLRSIASFTDYLLICTGSSDRHVQAIVDAIRDKLRESEVTPLHTEGYEQATWVLVDFVDFLVNVFTPETRDFYQLERVWRDAPVLLGERPEVVGDDDAGEAAAAKGREPSAGEPKGRGPGTGSDVDSTDENAGG